MQSTVRRGHQPAVEDEKPFDPWNTRSRSNQLRLHSYKTPAKEYVEVKIGGHPLDHRHADYSLPAPVHTPMKVVPRVTSGLNQSTIYEVQHKERMQYVEVKIGGHRYDHKRCVATDELLVGFNDQLASIESGGTGCSLCLLESPPLVQLYCRHAMCLSCFDLSTHNGTRVLCQVCFQKVPFLPPHLMTEKHVSASPGQGDVLNGLDVDKMTLAMSCVGIGYMGPKVVERVGHALRGISMGSSTVALASAAAASSSSIVVKAKEPADTDGAQRWKNRVQMVLEPSKLLRYEYVETLGKGNFSEVLLMRKLPSTRRAVPSPGTSAHLCVLKESDKLQEAMNEVSLLAKFQNPHVIRLHQYFIEQVGHLHYAYLELEYCDAGNLDEYIASNVGSRAMGELAAGLIAPRANSPTTCLHE
ncbi:serine/threonine protein kinase, variant [Aphanomyces invadans]|uniref:non-specific serine/threonine protein kinase n=1 Tax=Aphanomyces invadans TaxID=157072 RepID=A0A024UHL6_9STRA|nr:serine/threonine protein kinase, variant [Aphanomyces invadans]ETW05113.1 serine/threonine protein kinase, variant [Aphanomyces invadans]|eukprot:XP_008866550.1 serine/threonine protein kinase, variant [Aphanomyces invadans]